MRRPSTWLAIALLLAIGLLGYHATASVLLGLHSLVDQDLFGVDARIMEAVWRSTPRGWEPLLRFCTAILAGYTWPVWVVVLGLTAGVLWSRGFRPEAAGTVSLAATAVLGVVIAKLLFERARPAVEWASVLETSFSFPSGHAAHAVVVYGWGTYLAMRLTRSWRVGLLVVPLSLVMVLATALSRIYLGAHYPSDVLAGLSIGLIWLGCSIGLTELLYLRRRQDLRERVDAAALRMAHRAHEVARLVVRKRRAGLPQ